MRSSQSTPLKILLIDDEASILEQMKANYQHDFDFVYVDNEQKAKECLRDNSFDLVLLDLYLREDGDKEIAVNLLTYIKLNHSVPIIIVTRESKQEIVVELIKRGADNYLVKQSFDPARWKEIIDSTIEEAQQKIQPNILLIEDEQSFYKNLVAIMGKSCKITHAQTPEAAAELLKRQPFHLVLLDLHLTDQTNQDGQDFFIQTILPLPTFTPVVLISKSIAFTHIDDFKKGYKQIIGYINKVEFQAKELKKKILTYLKIPRVFISHTHADKERFVNKLVATFKNNQDVITWVDNMKLVAGKYLEPELAKAIFDSTHFLIILSDNTIDPQSGEIKKEWVQREFNFARNLLHSGHLKKIIPIILPGGDKANIGKQKGFELLGVNFPNLQEDKVFEQGMKELKKALLDTNR